MIESLDTKSENMKADRTSFENQMNILQDKVDILEMALQRTKAEL
jgi:hypothetical protein